MHPFKADFYGLQIKTIVLGYIRPEYNYVDVGEHPNCASAINATRSLAYIPFFFSTTDALIQDIETDKKVAIKSLDRDAYRSFGADPFFVSGKL